MLYVDYIYMNHDVMLLEHFKCMVSRTDLTSRDHNVWIRHPTYTDLDRELSSLYQRI